MGMAASLKAYSPDFDITETESWQHVTRQIQHFGYDLVIAEICTQNMEVISQIDKFRKVLPRLKMIFLGNEDEKVTGINYIRKGADAILSREMNEAEFHAALASVFSGKKYVFGAINDLILDNLSNIYAVNTLSTREYQIAQLLIEGKRTNEICRDLQLAPSTVSTVKSNIYKKMKVDNIVELMSKIPVPFY